MERRSNRTEDFGASSSDVQASMVAVTVIAAVLGHWRGDWRDIGTAPMALERLHQTFRIWQAPVAAV